MEQVNFTFYRETFGGRVIPGQPDFEAVEPAARAFVDKVTFQRAGKCEPEQKAVCACCEVLYENRGREGISSEHVDGYIVNYERSAPLYHKLWLAAWQYLPAEQFYRGVV
ncbi:MAG: hypothetical protein IJO50_02250 [Clostridia bacterium]|nr:hypothetical protein [Clostridia bacterium]